MKIKVMISCNNISSKNFTRALLSHFESFSTPSFKNLLNNSLKS